jgi:hypothetical protein
MDLVLVEFCAERLNEFATLLVDGADAIEVIVVFSDFQQSFAGHGFATEDIFEERDHIIAFLRTTK